MTKTTAAADLEFCSQHNDLLDAVQVRTLARIHSFGPISDADARYLANLAAKLAAVPPERTREG